jgi:hypothetical protein
MLFYDRPPLGYAVCGAPPIGWIVSIEWIGRLFISAYSQPFFLGSEQHKSVIDLLDKPNFDEPLDLSLQFSTGDWICRKSDDSSGRIVAWWTRAPSKDGYFYKVKMWDGAEAEFQKRAAWAYAAYKKALDNYHGSPPEALVRASLHFGCARLAVRMSFLVGTHPTRDQLASDVGELPVDVAKALFWLAAHDLLYTDLRPPNVIVLESGQGRLIDYDDMRVVPDLGEMVESEGVEAFSRCFNLGKSETDFTVQYPGIRKALVAILSAQRAAKRHCAALAAGGSAGASGPLGPAGVAPLLAHAQGKARWAAGKWDAWRQCGPEAEAQQRQAPPTRTHRRCRRSCPPPWSIDAGGCRCSTPLASQTFSPGQWAWSLR